MAKTTFSSLNLKLDKSVKTVSYNNMDIDILQYLPEEKKAELCQNVLNKSYDPTLNFANPLMVEVSTALEIMYFYTNISFTEKQKEDFLKTYDLLKCNDIIDTVFGLIPAKELSAIDTAIRDTIKSYYAYHTSILGILEQVNTDYSNLQLDAESIRDALADPENMKLLKGVVTKMG